MTVRRAAVEDASALSVLLADYLRESIQVIEAPALTNSAGTFSAMQAAIMFFSPTAEAGLLASFRGTMYTTCTGLHGEYRSRICMSFHRRADSA
jgi:hypothetical protein